MPTDEELIEVVAQAIFENHEEQCCTCGKWEDKRVRDREDFLRAAAAALAAMRAATSS